MTLKKIYLLAAIFFILPLYFYGQEDDIDKKVQVVKAYKPRVEEAYKITELPEITDTTATETEFNYYLIPKKVETEFEVDPIPAATMVGEPLTELYSQYVKLGMGSKLSPMAEFYIMSKRSDNTALGAFFQHHSSPGKVSLRNQDRVFAGYSKNYLSAFGKQIFRNSSLDASVGLKSNTQYFYGYDARNYSEDEIDLDKKNIKQNFLRLNADANYKTTYTDSLHLNYDIKMDFDHIEDNFESKESKIRLNADFDKFIENNIVGLSTGFSYIDHQSKLDTGSNTLFHFKPTIAKFGDEWKMKGGVNFVVDAVNGNAKLRIYPVARMEYDIVNHYIIPYAGIDGKIDLNSYYTTTLENPFIIPGLNLKNTNHNLIFYGGIKGNLSSTTYYNTRVKYGIFDDMPFFVNHFTSMDTLGNQFGVLYDDGEYLNLFGEISFEFSNNINFRAAGNLYQYTTNTLEKPWHKPVYDLTLSARYNIRDKIILSSEIYFSGKRWAQGNDDEALELDGFTDLNLKLEYRYSKVLSAYLRLNNILSDNYNVWNQYPVYGLQVYAGITYAF